MKQQILAAPKPAGRNKTLIIALLFATATAITLSGAVFSVYALMTNTSFAVFNTRIPGFVFGLLVIYLGLRYFLSVKRLWAELKKSSTKFSWDNFKKEKKK